MAVILIHEAWDMFQTQFFLFFPLFFLSNQATRGLHPAGRRFLSRKLLTIV